MILNMPVNNGATNSDTTPGQSEYTSFLKRKYSEHEINHNVNSSITSLDYEESTNQCNNNNNNWKKRHIDNEEHTHYHEQLDYSDTSVRNYKESQINESQDTTTGTFNIIANSSFINDLFAYDANLIVPVSVNNLSDNVLAEQQNFSTPTTVCPNTSATEFEDNNGDQWQASDLLELDHRYNSSLQTEISQLNPTVNLKAPEEGSASLQLNTDPNTLVQQQQQRQQQQQQRQQQQQQHQTQPFLLPQKPVASKRLTTSNSNSTTSTTCSSPSSSTTTSTFNPNHIEQDCDFEDKNLSWLLNFKFDEFPHLNPDVANLNPSIKNSKHQTNIGYNSNHNGTTTTFSYGGSSTTVMAGGSCTDTCPTAGVTAGSGCKTSTNATAGSNGSATCDRSKSPKNSNRTGKKFEELVMEATSELDGNDMVVAENVVIEESPHRAPKKPPFTYTELIEYALEDKGELTVSGIYQWISDRFPYYKSNDDRWKNSVRHNLSINPHFRKGHKAPQGAGHLWTISSGDSSENILAWEHKKQRLDLFFKMESMNRERLQQHQQQKKQQERLQQNGGQQKQPECQQDQNLYDEAAVAAAVLQQKMLQQTQNNNDASIQNQNSISGLESSSGHVLHELPYNDLLTDDELRKTAGQILNGIHREVEVQAVNQTIIGTYQDVLLDNDYMNPIHKDVVVNESGLRHTNSANISTHCHSNHSSTGPFYVTEIDPMELGIHMSSHNHHHQHHEHHQQQQQHASQVNDPSEESDVVLFNDEFNLNYFTYNPANDIIA